MVATTQEPMDAREFVQTLIEGTQETFIERINKLNDKDFCRLYIDLIKLILPPQQSVSRKDVEKRDNSLMQYVRSVLADEQYRMLA